jgi:hypothetical protein
VTRNDMLYIVEMECSYHLEPWDETEKEQWNARVLGLVVEQKIFYSWSFFKLK